MDSAIVSSTSAAPIGRRLSSKPRLDKAAVADEVGNLKLLSPTRSAGDESPLIQAYLRVLDEIAPSQVRVAENARAKVGQVQILIGALRVMNDEQQQAIRARSALLTGRQRELTLRALADVLRPITFANSRSDLQTHEIFLYQRSSNSAR